jgi:hypothetical protein
VNRAIKILLGAAALDVGTLYFNRLAHALKEIEPAA